MKNLMVLALVATPFLLTAQTVTKINSDRLYEMLKANDGNVQLIDVRTPEEVSYGIIEGAIHLDYYDGAFRAKADQLDKNKPTVIYCAVGGRSAYAGALFSELGFKVVYDLTDGFRTWKALGYPTVKL